MPDKNKSILAETLENIQNVKQQIEENANFALSSTLKDELSEIVKRGLSESFTSEDDEIPQDITADDSAVDSTPEDDTLDLSDIESDSELPDAAADALPGEDGEEVIDLTGATPEEVIGSFKLMEPTDEIEIVRTEKGMSVNFTKSEDDVTDDSIQSAIENPIDGEVGELPSELPAPSPMGDEMGGEAEPVTDEPTSDEDEEQLYEIEITEDEELVDEAMSHHMGMKRRQIAHNENDPNRVDETKELKESHNKLVISRKKVQVLMLENKKIKEDLALVAKNLVVFTKAEDEYKKSITALKTQLTEVALYTSNITYAVKLMTENTTTKDEKIKILKRLDGAKSVVESREVFKSLNESFKGNKTATQIIESKILNSDILSAASKINETVVYNNPQVDRIKEIISKMR